LAYSFPPGAFPISSHRCKHYTYNIYNPTISNNILLIPVEYQTIGISRDDERSKNDYEIWQHECGIVLSRKNQMIPKLHKNN